MRKWLTKRVWLLCVSLATGGWAADNLVKDPGFEEKAGTTWRFAARGQTAVRGELSAQTYHSGLSGARVEVPNPITDYVAWLQGVPVTGANQAPDEFSVWYSAPDADCSAALLYLVKGPDGKPVFKSAQDIPLPRSRDWSQIKLKIQPPIGVAEVVVELRVARPGIFHFDDVSLVRRAVTFTGKPTELLFLTGSRRPEPGKPLDKLWDQALTQAGWPTYRVVDWDEFSPELLQRARLVVAIEWPRRAELLPADRARLDLLEEYVKQGGGLLLNVATDQMMLRQSLLADTAMRRFGSRLLLEQMRLDPKSPHQQLGKWGDNLFFTDQVRGPVAEGIRGVCFPGTPKQDPFGAMQHVVPFVVDAPWQLTLSAGPGSATQPLPLGVDDFDRNLRPAGFERDVPLAGVREYGQGRVGYLGLYAVTIFTRSSAGEDGEVFTAYMTKGWDKYPSDLLKFYLNTFQWLAAHSDRIENATLTYKELPEPAKTTTWKNFRGVIGARTTYSSGESTPQAYIAKARKLGFDFIVFLEDFACLKPAAFDNLREDCRAASDGTFLAVPGISYRNSDGNHEYAYSPTLMLPSPLLLTRDHKRLKVFFDFPNAPNPNHNNSNIHWLYTVLGFENNSGWFNFSHNPYPSYDSRDVATIGLVTQENGQLLDLDLENYGVNNGNGQNLWPQAITLLKSAAELDKFAEGTYYANVVGAEGTKQLHPYLTTLAGRCISHLFPGGAPFGDTYITAGPDISLTMPRADTDAQGDLYNLNLQEWKMEISARSAAGLKEVTVMDGTRQIRRFAPGGAKEFAFATSIGKERQKYIWLKAKDVQDRQAFGRAINCNSWLLRENQCADRNNQLVDGRQLRPDGSEYFLGYSGTCAIADKGPWNGRLWPVGCYVLDKKLGIGFSVFDGSPEAHPQASLFPSVWYDGKAPKSVGWLNHLVTDREGAPHVKPYRIVASSDVLVADRILDGVFPCTDEPVVHVWHSIYPVTRSEYVKTTARTTFYLGKVDGLTAYLWEQDLELLKDIPTKPDSYCHIRLGTLASCGAREQLFNLGGAQTGPLPVKGSPFTVRPFNRGDYIGYLKHHFGSMVVYSLTDGLLLAEDGVNCGVGLKSQEPVIKAGTKYRIRLLMVGMHREFKDPILTAAKIKTDYGLGVKAAYQVECRQGEIRDAEYTLDALAGPQACVAATLRGIDKLDGNLGARVAGLNDNWTAWFQQQGETTKTRLIPVAEGIGYAVIQAADEGKSLFLGHPVVADKPEIVLNVARSQDKKSWRLEIHNPTDKALTVTVSASPQVKGVTFNETLTLVPGSSQLREL